MAWTGLVSQINIIPDIRTSYRAAFKFKMATFQRTLIKRRCQPGPAIPLSFLSIGQDALHNLDIYLHLVAYVNSGILVQPGCVSSSSTVREWNLASASYSRRFRYSSIFLFRAFSILLLWRFQHRTTSCGVMHSTIRSSSWHGIRWRHRSTSLFLILCMTSCRSAISATRGKLRCGHQTSLETFRAIRM